MNAELIPARTREISVGQRHGSVAILWGFRLGVSTLVAFQFAYAIDATGIGSLPAGDLMLFEPGALHLLEALRLGHSFLLSALKTGLTIMAILSVLELVPLAVLLVALCHRAPIRATVLWGRAIQHFPAFFLLSAITLLAQAAWLLAASISWTMTSAALARSSERLLTLVGIGWALLALLGAACIGAILDVSRAAAVRQGLSGREAMIAGVATLRARPWAALLGWVPAAIAAFSVVVATALIVHRIDVARGGLARLAAVFVVHQLAALGVCYARAAWLTNALRLVPRLSGGVAPAKTF